MIGWLLGPGVARIAGPNLVITDADGALVAQEAVNQQLRDDIARLEVVVSDGACVGESIVPAKPAR